MIRTEEVTGLVLAGGQGRRMGGVDKGLQSFRGQPMVAWSLLRFAPQVGGIVVNANQNLAAYEAFGYPVVLDALADYPGPLAGFQAGLLACATPYLATIPCDSPFLPADLVARLGQGLEQAQAQAAVARTLGQVQPVFMLMRADVLPSLEAFLRAGGRKIEAWYSTLAFVEVDFDDEADAFENLNSLAELRAAEARPA